jgi:hypothetical protein
MGCVLRRAAAYADEFPGKKPAQGLVSSPQRASTQNTGALVIFEDFHLGSIGIPADQLVLSAFVRHMSRPSHRHVRPMRREFRRSTPFYDQPAFIKN